MIFSADETVAGYLSYEDSAYPRAWHTLVAHLWAVGGATLDVQGFLGLVDVMAVSVWFLYVLLVTSVGSATAALCERAGLGRRVCSMAGCAAGVAVLLPAIATPQFVLGFQTSVLAALLLSLGARELLVHFGSLRAVCVTAIGVALLAHTWQLLLPPGVVMFIGATFGYVRSSRPRHQRLFIVSSASLLALAVAAEGIVAVWSQFGVGHAGEQGAVTPAPAWALLVCMLAVGAVSAASRFNREILLVGAALLSVVGTAFAISGLLGISLEMYYPTKLMWAFIINGVPFVAAFIAWAYEAAGRFFRMKELVIRVLFAMPLVLAFGVSVLSTVTLATGGWSMITDPRTVVAAITTSDAESAQVVWLGGERTDDVITRILLDFFRLERLDWTSEKTPQSALSLEEECEILRRAGDPAVLSDVEVTQVADRYDCVPGVRVIRVSVPQSPTVAGR
jgi:hypothetical protein